MAIRCICIYLIFIYLFYCLLLLQYLVIVKFDSKDFIKIVGEEIYISIRSEPKNGKANMELLKKLADYFKVPISDIKIISGKTSRKKVVVIKE